MLVAGAASVGNLVGPINAASAHPAEMGHDMSVMDTTKASAPRPDGLMITDNGYRLRLSDDNAPAGPATSVSFQITDTKGTPLRTYAPLHNKELHFIAVKRDLSGYQHLHPTRDATGTWTTPVALSPGVWRVFADFDPAGRTAQTTLGADLTVAGNLRPRAVPTPSRTASVDGYTVTLHGNLTPGNHRRLDLTIAKDGKPVTDLDPYLAAYGHLVALRLGDLAYLHVHPDGEPGDGATRPGPTITFGVTAPSIGRYRLFLDFKHHGTVRTAEFTVDTSTSATTTRPPAEPDSHEH